MKYLPKRLRTRFDRKYNSRFIAGIALLLAFVLQLTDAHSATAKTVFTPVRGYSPGDYTRIPFSLEELNEPSCRYQQIYRSAGFLAANGGGPVKITLFSFETDNDYGTPFDANLPLVEILMGVASRGPDELSEVFAENATNGMTVVWPKGPLRLVGASPGNARITPKFPTFTTRGREICCWRSGIMSQSLLPT